MKILSVINRNINGCVLYRQIIPHMEMHRAGLADVLFSDATTPIPDDKMKEYDIVQYHKGYINLKELKRFERLGVKAVCDFDDYWELPKSHGLYNEYYYENKQKDGKIEFAHNERGEYILKKYSTPDFFKDILRQFPYITTTTPLLAEQIYPYNKNVGVFENALHPLSPMMEIKPVKNDKIRFGWLGGSQHWIDIQLLRGVPNRLNFDKHTKGKYKLQIFGYMEKTVYDNFAEIFTDYHKIREPLEVFPPRPAMHDPKDPSYIQYYNYMDVALIPLADTKFNSLKSELKVIEAGFFRKPVIVSGVQPYLSIINDTNALIVRKRNDWFKHIKRLIQNPNLREDLGEALYDAVSQKYHIGNVNERRFAFYKSICI